MVSGAAFVRVRTANPSTPDQAHPYRQNDAAQAAVVPITVQ
jgi:hypothetical protein